MKTRCLILFCVLAALTGCRSARVSPKSGTEVQTDGEGRMTTVTYVTQEEYQRMTPQERERVHATVGAEATAPLWGNAKPPSEAVSTSELDKAMSSAKADKK